MMRDTRAVCMAWPARSAITCPSSGLPISARSPIRSSTLWRQHSSLKRRPSGIQNACRGRSRRRYRARRRGSVPCCASDPVPTRIQTCGPARYRRRSVRASLPFRASAGRPRGWSKKMSQVSRKRSDGQNRDALARCFHRNRPPNAQIAPAAAVRVDARLPDQLA